jgi:hypothetical protein
VREATTRNSCAKYETNTKQDQPPLTFVCPVMSNSDQPSESVRFILITYVALPLAIQYRSLLDDLFEIQAATGEIKAVE